MRYLLSCILASLVLVACNDPEKKDSRFTNAEDYFNYIGSRHSKSVDMIMAFAKRPEEMSLDSTELMLDNFANQVNGLIKEIAALPPYRGDSALRNAALVLQRFYRRILGDEYKRIIRISMTDSAFTEEGQNQMNRILDAIGKEEEGYDDAFQRVQQQFARKNGMRLVENEQQKEIDALDKLNEQ